MGPLILNDSWWNTSIENTLQNLSSSKIRKNKKKYTDEELFEATGGVRFGMHARRRRRSEVKYKRCGEETLTKNVSDKIIQASCGEKRKIDKIKNKKNKKQKKEKSKKRKKNSTG